MSEFNSLEIDALEEKDKSRHAIQSDPSKTYQTMFMKEHANISWYGKSIQLMQSNCVDTDMSTSTIEYYVPNMTGLLYKSFMKVCLPRVSVLPKYRHMFRIAWCNNVSHNVVLLAKFKHRFRRSTLMSWTSTRNCSRLETSASYRRSMQTTNSE